jgi:zinc transport system substrate-binding protein
MIRHLFASGLALITASTLATAQVPRVATDIAPVHSLVTRVMQGVGEAALIVPPNASPHGHAMRPSEAASLEIAQLIFWIGDDLTPWFGEAVETLAPQAHLVELLHHQDTLTQPARTLALFVAPPAGHEAKDDDHDDDHGHGHADDHADDGVDPHAWLDPENGKIWLKIIATELSKADPANAANYAENAAAGAREIAEVVQDIDALLLPHRTEPFVVFHDAFQYFEKRFALSATGSIAISDGTKPGPARVAEIRAAVIASSVQCIFAEPQFNQGLTTTVAEGTGARVAVLDPIGTRLKPGSDLYRAMLHDIAAGMKACLQDGE